MSGRRSYPDDKELCKRFYFCPACYYRIFRIIPYKRKIRIMCEHPKNEPMGMLSVTDEQGEDKPKPWEKRRLAFSKEQVIGRMRITLANQIYVETANLKSALKNSLRRMGAFSNPQFYKKQAMSYETRAFRGSSGAEAKKMDILLFQEGSWKY